MQMLKIFAQTYPMKGVVFFMDKIARGDVIKPILKHADTNHMQ